jgi:[ribosomal protein S5]-alanine N-acetyltransferase
VFAELNTNRLTLRRLDLDDIADLHLIRSDELVNRFINRPKSLSHEDVKEFILTINKKIDDQHSCYWAIEINTGRRLIGTICLFNFNDQKTVAEIGYELNPAYHGRGIMQEAIASVLKYGGETLRLSAFTAVCKPANIRSVNLLMKNGFLRNEELELQAPEEIREFNIYTLKAGNILS